MLRVEVIIGLIVLGGWGAFRSFHSVDAGHVLVVRQFGEIVAQRGDGFQTIATWQSAEEVSTQVESQQFQTFKEAPPQILSLPSGAGTLLDPSTFLQQRPQGR